MCSSAVAHPNIAYLLLSLGMLALTIELWSPARFSRASSAASALLLAFFALPLLPVNYAGLLLILLRLAAAGLEIKVTSYGVLTVGGARQPDLRVDDPDGLAAARTAVESAARAAGRHRLCGHCRVPGAARRSRPSASCR